MQRLPRVLLLAGLLMLLPTVLLFSNGGQEDGGASSEQVELRVWYATGTNLDPLVEAYEDQSSDVSLNVEQTRTEDIRSRIQVSLQSGTGPDVFEYDTGVGYAGALVEADMLLPLDSYYEQYGWDDRFFGWTVDRVRFGESLYGIPFGLEYIGTYYNKAIFNELDLSVPQTYEDFLSTAEALKQADYIPVAFANQNQWPAFHMFSIFANTLAGKDKIESLLFENQGTWEDPDFVKAIRLPFVEMNQTGYFIEGTNGVSYDDGNLLFFTGEAGMHITGMWLLGDIMDNVENPDDIGFFAFPSIDGNPSLPPAGVSAGLLVSANTDYPDVAAEFLNFVFSEEMGPVWIEDAKSLPPYAVDLAPLDLAPLERNMNATMQEVSQGAGGGMGYNIDVLTPPRFNEAMATGFQEVIAGEKTAEEQAADLQRAWEAEQGN